MTSSGSNQDDDQSIEIATDAIADDQAKAAEKANRLKWANNPETIHSLSDVASPVVGEPLNAQQAFLLTEGESVIASKATARAESMQKESARDSFPQVTTDQLLSHWSGQKVARKSRGPNLQEQIFKRIRDEIEVEIEAICQADYQLGTALILIARAFGKDPRQWLPGDKVSNLFIEAVIYSAGLTLPWDFDSIPDYAELKFIMGEDKRFSRIFRSDKLRPQESAEAFAQCKIADGDIALWVNPAVRQSGFIERAEGGQHNILAGGCIDSPTGFIYTTLEFFMQTYAGKNPTPDVVYRLEKLR